MPIRVTTWTITWLFSLVASFGLGSWSHILWQDPTGSMAAEAPAPHLPEQTDAEISGEATRQRPPSDIQEPIDWYQRLKDTREPNQRIAALIEILSETPTEELPSLYRQIRHSSRPERDLLLEVWVSSDQLAALDFLRNEDPEQLETALRFALRTDNQSTIAWAQATGVQSLVIQEFLGDEAREIPEEQELAETNESPQPDPESESQPDWTKDFPKGLTINGTAREIAKLAAHHPDRARYWLKNTWDRLAARQAAADIGWESTDLGNDTFAEWLNSLDPEMAAIAAAGYLERLSATDPALALEFAENYGDQFNLDYGLYLAIVRIIRSSDGNIEITHSLIAEITDFNVYRLAEGRIVELELGRTETHTWGSLASIAMVSSAEASSHRMFSNTWNLPPEIVNRASRGEWHSGPDL